MAPVFKLKQLGGIGVDAEEEAEAYRESYSQHLSLKVSKG